MENTIYIKLKENKCLRYINYTISEGKATTNKHNSKDNFPVNNNKQWKSELTL